MANVVLAIITLVLTFVLAGYGVYTNIEASKRTQVGTLVGSTIDRELAYVQDIRQDVGHVPAADDVDAARFARASNAVATFSYVENAGVGFVCGGLAEDSEVGREALAKVAAERPGAFVSGQCGNSGSGGSTVVSVRVG